MRPSARARTGVLRLGLSLVAVLCFTGSARADLTVYCRYQFTNGDTVSRPTYLSASHMRATMSDGNEAIYDAKTKQLTFINHANKRYWKGPIDRANAIVDSLTLERDKPFWEAAQERQQEWMAFTDKFNNSITATPMEKTKKIATKECVGFEISAGKSMVHTRWIAPDLEVPVFTKEIEKVLMLPALDPVGRSIMRLIGHSQRPEGLTLAASTKFETPTQKGSFSWEAYRLDTKVIPESVWAIPEGYEEIKF